MASTALPFFKMNGIGNSILVVDTRSAGIVLTPETARAAAGLPQLGFDQLMAIGEPCSRGSDAYVTIFNADGSEAGACGNGTRCVAWVLMRDGDASRLTVETAAGRLACEKLGPTRFSVDMGPPALSWQEIPLAEPVTDTIEVPLAPIPGLATSYGMCTAIGMGNPHAVFFMHDVAQVPIEEVGPLVEHHPMFPARTNVSFAEVLGPTDVRLRVWERSAGATLACGSAACATAVAGVRRGLVERRVRVALPGGDLEIEWRASDGHVIMTGDVELEHAGRLPADLPGLAA